MKKSAIRDGFLEYINTPENYKKALYNNRCSLCKARNPEALFIIDQQKMCGKCVLILLHDTAGYEDFSQWQNSEILDALSAEGSIPRKLSVIWNFREIHDTLTDSGKHDLVHELVFLLIMNILYPLTHPLAGAVKHYAKKECQNMRRSILPYILALCAEQSPVYLKTLCLLAVDINHLHPRVEGLLYFASRSEDKDLRETAQKVQFSGQTLAPYELEIIKKECAAPADKYNRLTFYMLEAGIARYYQHKLLKKVYARYLEKIITGKYPASWRPLAAAKTTDFIMYNVFSEILFNEALFNALMAALPVKVKAILEFLAWDKGVYPAEFLENRFQCKIRKKETVYRYADLSTIIEVDYLIIPLKFSEIGIFLNNALKYFFYLPYELAYWFRKWLPVPGEYNLKPIGQIASTLYLFQDKGAIIDKINLIYNFLAQGGLHYTTQGKVSSHSLRQFIKIHALTEFYEEKNKELQYLRSKMIIGFMHSLAGNFRSINDPPAFLKETLTGFFTFKNNKDYKLLEMLNYIRGNFTGLDPQNYNERAVRESFFNFLKTLQEGSWYSLEDLFKYIKYREIRLDIIDRQFAASNLYFQQSPGRSTYGSMDRKYIAEFIYNPVVLFPFIKAFFFLCASLGMADLAYVLPENAEYATKGYAYLSVYDGLKYVRLTSLGAYITGTRPDFAFSAEQKSATLSLDDKRLYIYLDHPDPVKQMILDRVGVPVSKTCYKVDYRSFLKECGAEKDIKARISFFKKNIAMNPPPVWEEFLTAVLTKVEPLEVQNQYTVFRIKEDKELSALIINDKILKRYVLKAENYHILVARCDFLKVKKRLEEFGYLIGADIFDRDD